MTTDFALQALLDELESVDREIEQERSRYQGGHLVASVAVLIAAVALVLLGRIEWTAAVLPLVLLVLLWMWSLSGFLRAVKLSRRREELLLRRNELEALQ